MASDAERKRLALLDWENELNYQKKILPLQSGNDRKMCEDRIAECKAWISKIEAM